MLEKSTKIKAGFYTYPQLYNLFRQTVQTRCLIEQTSMKGALSQAFEEAMILYLASTPEERNVVVSEFWENFEARLEKMTQHQKQLQF